MKQMKKLKKQLLILSLAFFIGSSGFSSVNTGTIKTNPENSSFKFYSMSPTENTDGR